MTSLTINQESQRNELIAINSIYDTLELDFPVTDLDEDKPLDNVSGIIPVYVDTQEPFNVISRERICDSFEEEYENKLYKVDYLPPITLGFSFPANYPSESAPMFTISCSWLSQRQISRLCREFDKLSVENEGCELLFLWIDFLQHESLKIAGVNDTINLVHKNCIDIKEDHDTEECDTRAVQLPPDKQSLLDSLIEYDQHKSSSVFNSKSFTCDVCFETRAGTQCMEFVPCKHVFCRECVKGHFETLISEGKYKNVRCLGVDCKSDALPNQVQQIVSLKLFARWESHVLENTLSSLSDVQFCPLKHCQCPVTIENNQGICPRCHNIFCSLCRGPAHGSHLCPADEAKLAEAIKEYTDADNTRKKELETTYGKKKLIDLVDKHLMAEYVKENARTCPECQAPIEKNDGCNKMCCGSCYAHFCWLCMEVLEGNPYHHFSDKESPCYNQLYLGASEEFMNPDIWDLEEEFMNEAMGNFEEPFEEELYDYWV